MLGIGDKEGRSLIFTSTKTNNTYYLPLSLGVSKNKKTHHFE
jgi:hypothetical protein